MKLHLVNTNGNQFDIWISLDETEKAELPNANESLIIGSGKTALGAVGAASAAFSDALTKMMQEERVRLLNPQVPPKNPSHQP